MNDHRDKQSLKILLIDDDLASLRLTERFLKKLPLWDIQCMSCSDCREPLPLFHGQYPDVVMVDYILGSEDGLTLVRRLQQEGWRSAFILLTGRGDERVAIEALHAGVDDYIIKKDFSVATLDRTLRYVNEQKQARESLRKSEEKFRGLLEMATDGNIIADAKGLISSVNFAAETMFGYAHGALIGKEIEVLIPARYTKHAALRVNFMKNPKARPFSPNLELYGVRKSGEEFPVEISLTPLQTPEGTIVLATIRDISERKRSDSELAKKTSYLHLLQTVTAAANTADEVDAALQFVLDAVCDHTGWPVGHAYVVKPGSSNSLVPSPVWHMNSPDLFDVFRDVVSGAEVESGIGLPGEVLKCGKPQWIGNLSQDARFLHQSVATDVGLNTAFAIPVLIGKEVVAILEFFSADAEEPNSSLLEVMGDIGVQLGRAVERKRAFDEHLLMELRVQQFQKLESLGVLAGGIAHDFNNVLQAIFGFMEIATDELRPGSAAYDALTNLNLSAHRAKDLVQQILTFSRKGGIKKQQEHLQKIIEETMEMVRAVLPATIEIRKQIDTSCGPVLADATQIHQVIMNLCTNAFHAMRDTGGTLDIQLKPMNGAPDDGPMIRIQVRDTGHGMDQKTMSRIFEPFFTTKQVGVGTGLGMSTVHGIIHSHGGEIFVESELGRGTTFTILLPQTESTTTHVDQKALEAQGRGERILYLDDEELLANLGRTILEKKGYHTTVHTDSTEALEDFRAHPLDFDLVVTDQNMPHLTGTMLASEISKINPDIPIILMSGFIDSVVGDAAMNTNIGKILLKPISSKELNLAIRSLLDTETRGI